MKRPLKRGLAGVLGLIILCSLTFTGCLTDPCSCCCDDPGPDSTEKFADTICVWLASDRDTYASYGRVGEEADRNFADYSPLAIAKGELARKQAYVNFARPVFPQGAEILEAKFEMFHGGKNEDGTTDDILVNVGSIKNEAWSRSTLTWNNRPDRGGVPPVDVPPIRLRSQAWSGTDNIAGAAQEMLITQPNNHYGFVVSLGQVFGVEKGFYSNNDIRRKRDDMGLSPRMVMKIRLPAGKTTQDIQMPFLSPDHDFSKLVQPITTIRFSPSNDYPADWNVSPNR
ncbi:MAG: DNRLRE domain-containing protein [Armatimonadetes bacterium]|nr:DNRLRE domain-containing protein [Armatimonadota bacterium]